MSRTIRPTAKSPNRPPTISIGVIRHLSKVNPSATAFQFAAGKAIPATGPGEALNATIIALFATRGDE
jgi:hypothetical protein